MRALGSPTLKHVAAHAGVSVATASAVVNGADWVTEETASRVRAAVQALGYRPNRVARSLKTRRVAAVGTIVSDLTNPFFTEVVRALTHALREQDRTLLLADADHRFDLGAEAFEAMLEERVDALVLIGDSVHEETLRAHLARRLRVPIIAIERDYALDGVSTLLVDSEQAAYRATRHLLEQGYRRVAHIAGPEEGAGSTTFGRRQRLDGYRRALSEAGLTVERDLVVPGTFRFEGGRAAMHRLLALPEPPDAVFCANDMTALGAMAAAREAGLRLPDDLGLVGFDDIPMAALVDPPLTTMAMPKAALGRAAAEAVGQLLATNHPLDSIRRRFDADLVVRASSRRTPSPDALAG